MLKILSLRSCFIKNYRIDVPFKELGFFGTVDKEMSPVFPTAYTLSSFDSQFCVNLDDVDHVHFEVS